MTCTCVHLSTCGNIVNKGEDDTLADPPTGEFHKLAMLLPPKHGFTHWRRRELARLKVLWVRLGTSTIL
jgi:hypothetical protein